MAKFDFIESSVRGYDFVWSEKSYLTRVAVPVVFIKMICWLTVYVLKIEDDLALQGLIFMPSYMVEALFCVGVIRYALYGESIMIWGRAQPVPEDGVQPKAYSGYYSKLQCYYGGIAIYCLIKVIYMFMAAVLDSIPAPEPPADLDNRAAGSYVLSMFAMIGALSVMAWAFRLVWLYIPIAMGIPLQGFLRVIRGFQSSFYMLLLWLVCLLPIATVAGIAFIITASIFGDNMPASILVIYALTSIAEVVMIAVQTVAMTHAIKYIFKKK